MSIRYEPAGQHPPRVGLFLLQGLILTLFSVFALRLWYLQIHKGDEFALKARENRLRQEAIYAPRGLIRDRDGVLLAVNEPAYALAIVREDCPDVPATLGKVSEWTGVPYAELYETYERNRRKVKPFDRLILVPDLPFSLLARIEAGALRWPGLEIMVRPRRFYPQGPLLAHILGYVAEADDAELEKESQLDLGDTVGKQGIEFVLEDRLRGSKGLRQMEVDASGRHLNRALVRRPTAGRDVRLSIELDLQRFVTMELTRNDYAGGVAVLEPFTGQVLSLVSTPGFDNNAFASGLSPEQWKILRDDPLHPLQNRAIQGIYPPGSVFKLVVAGAGLHEGIIDPTEKVHCPGFMKLGRRIFRCWRKYGHGKSDLERGLVESCDVYFYEMGNRLGVDRIEAFAKACGFGSPTGVDLPHERGGLIPSREWKTRRFGERWQGGENLNLAIGQGYTLVQPLQVARYLGALLNGGYLLKPTLLATEKPEVQGRIPLSEENIARIVRAMEQTVEGDRGTARRLRTPGARMGGKTGTAQVVKLGKDDQGRKTEEIEYQFRDHSWIASWGIMNGHAVVVVVVIEHGGHGAEAAVPVARMIYDFLFLKTPAGYTPMTSWPEPVAAYDWTPPLPAASEGVPMLEAPTRDDGSPRNPQNWIMGSETPPDSADPAEEKTP